MSGLHYTSFPEKFDPGADLQNSAPAFLLAYRHRFVAESE
jgi:hypothetical protein